MTVETIHVKNILEENEKLREALRDWLEIDIRHPLAAKQIAINHIKTATLLEALQP